MEKQSVTGEKRAKTSINLKQSLRNAAIKHLIDLTGETEISKAVEIALTEWLERGGRATQSTPENQGHGSSTLKSPLQIAPNPPKMSSDQRRRMESAVWQILEAFRGVTAEAPDSADVSGPGAKPGAVSSRRHGPEKPVPRKASGARKQNGG